MRALVRPQFFDQIANLEADLRVESGGGFVEEQELRFIDQSEREGEALLLAAGQGRVGGIFFFLKLQAFQQRFAVSVAGIKRCEKIERFTHGDLVGKIRRLQTNADAILQFLLLAVGIEIKNFHVPGGARSQTLQDFERGGFARAVRSEEAEDFSRSHFEIDAFDCFQGVVGFAKSADIDDEIVVHGFSTWHYD